MAFEEIKENIADLKENSKQYLDASVEYYSLLGFKITAKAAILLFKCIVLSLFGLLSLLLLSFAAAYAIGQCFTNYAIGFVIVGVFYLVVIMFLYFYGSKLFEKPIIKALSEIFYKD
ncbi:hypothetical protein K5I29_10815 [Flavobacterium agricola]|uniref:Superfamily III holin-X n=1 Tax=Flavobacterium agricola TaxID=2870839 RepID=A0ABY6LXB0_9FLAO|nr:hypothetical protein [Flavobacterium agricola]UYW00978.1 hypothetical protein K5I29_10815 [Flavobacterium agricola]